MGSTVVFLPGFAGSVLVSDTKGLLWNDYEAVLAGRYKYLALQADGKTPAVDPGVVSAVGVSQRYYGGFLEYLALQGNNVFVFPWDWRKDLQSQAALFDTWQAKIRGNYFVVSHSAGSLLFRWWLRGLTSQPNQVLGHVSAGAANHGSFTAVQGLLGFGDFASLLEWGAGIHEALTGNLLANTEKTVRQLVSNFPSVYQLLPDPGKYKVNNYYQASYYQPWQLNTNFGNEFFNQTLADDAFNKWGLFNESNASDLPTSERLIIRGVGRRTTNYDDPNTNDGDGVMQRGDAYQNTADIILDRIEEHVDLLNREPIWEAIAKYVSDPHDTDYSGLGGQWVIPNPDPGYTVNVQSLNIDNNLPPEVGPYLLVILPNPEIPGQPPVDRTNPPTPWCPNTIAKVDPKNLPGAQRLYTTNIG